jgi:hypothetical protein
MLSKCNFNINLSLYLLPSINLTLTNYEKIDLFIGRFVTSNGF